MPSHSSATRVYVVSSQCLSVSVCDTIMFGYVIIPFTTKWKKKHFLLSYICVLAQMNTEHLLQCLNACNVMCVSKLLW